MPGTLPVAPEELLDLQGIAARANVPLRMAQRLVTERRLPVVKIGRYVRVRARDLDTFLDRNTRPTAQR